MVLQHVPRFDPRYDAKNPMVAECEHLFSIRGWETWVPAGFATDLASVPRIFIWLIMPFGSHQRPALLHDYHYRTQECTRFEADTAFRIFLEWEGNACWKTWLLFYAVRCWGWITWAKHKQALAAKRAKEGMCETLES